MISSSHLEINHETSSIPPNKTPELSQSSIEEINNIRMYSSTSTCESDDSQGWQRNKELCCLLVITEVFCVIFYSPWCLKYTDNTSEQIGLQYAMFQHVSCMMFLGFGLLMVCSARLGISSVVNTFIIGTVCIQYGMLFHHFWGSVLTATWKPIELELSDLIVGNFASATALISFGAVIGHVTPAQMLIATLVQIPLYSLNESILAKQYTNSIQAVDMGGSMFVHTFGALSGIAMSIFLKRPICDSNINNKDAHDGIIPNSMTSYHSDIFSFIGTIVLWMFWPSFNGALAVGSGWYRVVLNTTIALSASCVSSVFMASVFSKDGQIVLEVIQNAALAGGVAVGSSSDLVIGPHIAIIIGVCAGAISSWGFLFGKEMVKERFKIDDVCGVLWLHGIPGIMGGLIGSLSAAVVNMNEYTNTNRDNHVQARYQLAALVVTIAMSLSTGYLMAFVANTLTPLREYMSDKSTFVVADDFPLKKE